MSFWKWTATLLISAGAAFAQSDVFRCAVIGDTGTGGAKQYAVSKLLAEQRKALGFGAVIMLGDNLYGGKKPGDFKKKFEEPYKQLLGAGVKFYAALGNHDDPNERFYKPFNMGENRYYTFKNGNAEFFVLDSTYLDRKQLDWIASKLDGSGATWKICYFHHPPFSDGAFHGSDMDLRKLLLPIFEKYGVDIVFSGHEHVYERIKPQNGIYYFVLGNSGELRYHNLRPSALMAKGFDADQSFMLVEIAGDEAHFQAISRTGETVDSGVMAKQKKPGNVQAAAP